MTKLLLTTLLILAATNPAASTYNSLIFDARNKAVYFHNTDFSPETLKVYLHFCGISNTEIVFKQAEFESARFKSYLFKKYNNLFGMCEPKIRETESIGPVLIEGYYYATYKHWTNSVKDYAIWQSVQAAKFSTANYYEFLTNSGYATNENYNKILKGIK